MSVQLSLDQYRGQKNIVADGNGRKLGEIGYLQDTTVNGNGPHIINSGRLVKVQVVEAEATLSPGNAVTFTADKHGTHVDAVAADDAAIDGIVDPELTSDVVSGDTFLLIIGGPVLVTVNGNVAGPNIVGAGSGKVKTALSTVANKSGRTIEDGSSKADGQTMRVDLGRHH